MDVFDAIRTRRSIRKFKQDPIPEATLRELIEFATLAPSASNKQMWKFCVITNREILGKINDAILAKLDALAEMPGAEDFRSRLRAVKNYSTFFTDAPAVIAAFREPYRSSIDVLLENQGLSREKIDSVRQRPDIQSLGAAIENLCLAAHAKGLGTCWMSAPCIAGPEIAELLEIEPPWELVAFIPIGVSSEEPIARPRKPLEEVVKFVV